MNDRAQPYCDDCGNTDPECPLTRPATREEKIVRPGVYEVPIIERQQHMNRKQILEVFQSAGFSKDQCDSFATICQIMMNIERDACAKIVEDHLGRLDDKAYEIAAAIRARGQA